MPFQKGVPERRVLAPSKDRLTQSRALLQASMASASLEGVQAHPKYTPLGKPSSCSANGSGGKLAVGKPICLLPRWKPVVTSPCSRRGVLEKTYPSGTCVGTQRRQCECTITVVVDAVQS